MALRHVRKSRHCIVPAGATIIRGVVVASLPHTQKSRVRVPVSVEQPFFEVGKRYIQFHWDRLRYFTLASANYICTHNNKNYSVSSLSLKLQEAIVSMTLSLFVLIIVLPILHVMLLYCSVK